MTKIIAVKGAIQTYKTYRFIDKDPMIDKLRTVVKEKFQNHKGEIHYGLASERSGVSDGTLRNWFEGGTKRPQFATMCAVARAADYDLVLVKRKPKAVKHVKH